MPGGFWATIVAAAVSSWLLGLGLAVVLRLLLSVAVGQTALDLGVLVKMDWALG